MRDPEDRDRLLIDLPKDVMAELGDRGVSVQKLISAVISRIRMAHVGQLKRAMKMLNKAKRPLFLAGGGVKIAHASEEFTEAGEYYQCSGCYNGHGKRCDSDKSSAYI